MVFANAERVMTHPDQGSEYVTYASVVERHMVIQQQHPFSGSAVGHAGRVPYALPDQVAVVSGGQHARRSCGRAPNCKALGGRALARRYCASVEHCRLQSGSVQLMQCETCPPAPQPLVS